MSGKNYINAYCSISKSEIRINSGLVFSGAETSAKGFFTEVYRHYKLDYPKFFKMDSLCKLAFLASELLLKTFQLPTEYARDDISIVIANSASSLHADTEHQALIADKDNYFPSPSVFVYTLPNILIGEIAIRNSITGENTFFIFDKFDAEFMCPYVNSLLDRGRAKCCITGWVDLYDDSCEAFLYIADNKPGPAALEHSPENLKDIIK